MAVSIGGCSNKAGKQTLRRQGKICGNSIQIVSETPISEPAFIRFNNTGVKIARIAPLSLPSMQWISTITWKVDEES